MRHSRKRHIAKTITWRIVGTIDTVIIGFLFTNELDVSLSIGGVELFTKMLLYYFHERIWFNLRVMEAFSSHIRHISKAITWRIIGTIDTIIIGWIITGDPLKGVSIGGMELITKMLLYYLHERLWYQSKFGLSKESE